MKREFKFRAFYVKEQRMMTWEDILNDKNIDGEDMQAFFNNTMSDVSPLMQFTGRKDKNGKEIYFQDIVKINIYLKNRYAVAEQDEWGALHFVNNTDMIGNRVGFDLFQWDLFNCEVVGNVYENPELIVVGKNYVRI